MNKKTPDIKPFPGVPPRDPDAGGFLAALGEWISPQGLQSLAACRHRPRGRKARVPLTQLLPP